MDAIETAWLAGLYEGEGCLYHRKDGGGYELVISMTDEDVIRKCQGVTGYGTLIHFERPEPGWKALWRWRVGRRDQIEDLLLAIRPHLGRRRGELADQFLDWMDAGCPISRTDEQRATSAAAMRRSRARRKLRTAGQDGDGSRRG
jgi:hypothetical protein